MAAQGLHGLQGFIFFFFLAAHGLQGLHGLQVFLAAHGLHGFLAAQGLHGLQGLHGFLAAHGLHEAANAPVVPAVRVAAPVAATRASGMSATPERSLRLFIFIIVFLVITGF